ncbi:hypothetical protein GCM10007203_18190 [Staphylococcus nepalensis]|nr:hypothetical protein GCM10007203_18190 [Staphylococcus nepalensis]
MATYAAEEPKTSVDTTTVDESIFTTLYIINSSLFVVSQMQSVIIHLNHTPIIYICKQKIPSISYILKQPFRKRFNVMEIVLF